MKKVMKEVVTAYCDCSDSNGERNLSFLASEAVDPKTAAEIMTKACPDGYNNFEAELLTLFPDDAKIWIAREGSVCIYVESASKLPTRKQLQADEYDVKNGRLRIWWD